MEFPSTMHRNFFLLFVACHCFGIQNYERRDKFSSRLDVVINRQSAFNIGVMLFAQLQKTCGGLPNVFFKFEFQDDRSKNVGALGGQNLPFPINKAHRLYNCLLLPHNGTSRVIVIISLLIAVGLYTSKTMRHARV